MVWVDQEHVLGAAAVALIRVVDNDVNAKGPHIYQM